MDFHYSASFKRKQNKGCENSAYVEFQQNLELTKNSDDILIFKTVLSEKNYQLFTMSEILTRMLNFHSVFGIFCQNSGRRILQNSDIAFLSKQSETRNNLYSAKGIGTQGSIILSSYSFPKSLIPLAFTS